jgi:L-lactate dehydrogenase (cytochrome)
MLPKIADAVGSQIEVLFDGGIRSGQDIMRALGLGAKGCLIGRAYQYGLGAGGEAGVAKAIDILRTELDVTMALCGVKRVADIDRRVIAEDIDVRPRAVDAVPRPAAGQRAAVSIPASRT